MLFYEELNKSQMESLRERYFDEIDEEYDSLEDIPDSVLETHYRHQVFSETDFK